MTALLFLSTGLRAQQAVEESSQLTHEETIAKALSDLQSPNVDTRVGSVMLLGKYEDIAALSGVTLALSDPHVRVRRAALVSMIEIQATMPPQAVEKILLMLGDEDAEIRRMVSYNLAMLINLWNSHNRGNQLIPIRPALPLPVRQRFINAFLDEDVIVRRNMLSFYFYLGVQLPESILLSLLEDEDDMVRLEALRLCVRISQFAVVVKQAESLVNDPVQSIRMLFANMLGNNRDAESVEWLEILLKDESEEVANEAELSLFRIRPNLGGASRLLDFVLAGRFSEEQSNNYIKTLSILGKTADQLIERLLDSDNPTYRLEALRIFLTYADLDDDTKRILQMAQDKSERVRAQVLNYLRAARETLPPRLVEGLAFARDSKVRETALALTRRFDSDEAEPLLFDFLIDEESRIRMMAIDEIVRRNIPGLRDTLHLSLEDDDWLIQRRAVTHLI
ncbi:MAG: HEAT repeat domain-containing protein, partial [Verrucomicrobiae bacterium]|nr:HEAT repeat domain-containing protein [Verrucomicrobiae bacterium]